MWSVVLVNRMGAIVDVLSHDERELCGAVAFAAGYGSTDAGAAVVMRSAMVATLQSELLTIAINAGHSTCQSATIATYRRESMAAGGLSAQESMSY
jgi:hypothetical protein